MPVAGKGSKTHTQLLTVIAVVPRALSLTAPLASSLTWSLIEQSPGRLQLEVAQIMGSELDPREDPTKQVS